MGCVNKAAFAQPLRQQSEQYPLPEYGDGAYVVVQALTSKDLLDLQEKYGKSPSSSNADFVYEVFARTLVDDAGRPIFDGPEDVKQNVNLSIPAMEALIEKVFNVSGIKFTEDEEKN